MSDLTFSASGNVFESDVISLTDDSVIELHFSDVPEYKGVDVDIYQSLSGVYWQKCFHETLYYKCDTFCKAVKGVSENAQYKVVCSINPDSAKYE